MTNLPATINDQLNNLVPTADGNLIQLQPGQSVLDFIPQGGGNTPLWTLRLGQNIENAYPDAEGTVGRKGREPKYFLARSKAGGSKDAPKEKEFILLDSEIKVYPIGIRLARSYFSGKYDANDIKPADCASTGGPTAFMMPDVKFRGEQINGSGGVIASCCAVLDEKTGRIVEVCPLAQKRSDPSGKFIPPPCKEQYILAVAIQTPAGTMELAELYFKSSSAGNGRKLVTALNAQRKAGAPLWKHPVRLTARLVGVGNVVQADLLVGETLDIDPEDTDTPAALDAMAARFAEAEAYLAERAAKPAEQEAASEAIPFDNAPAGETVIDVKPNGGNGNGGKSKPSPKAKDVKALF